MNDWLPMTCDFFAASLAMVATVLSTQHRRETWLFSLLSSLLYLLLFMMANADFNTCREVLFIGIACYGFLNWPEQQNDYPVHSLPTSATACLALIMIGLYAYLTLYFQQAFLLSIDLITSLLSAIAFLLLSWHYLECWLLWIVADCLYLTLYFEHHYWFSMIKSLLYIGLASYALYSWSLIYWRTTTHSRPLFRFFQGDLWYEHH